MASSRTNERASSHVKIGGPDDTSNRSAWSTTNRSFNPPSLVHRKPALEDAVMTSSRTDECTSSHVKFGGPDDTSNRSAWSTTNRSFNPPPPVRRKPTLNSKEIGEILAVMNKSSRCKPSVIKGKNRSQTVPVPILKNGKHVYNHGNKNDDDPSKISSFVAKCDLVTTLFSQKPKKGLRKTRSAWDVTETRNSATSVFGLAPAQRQKTLEGSGLLKAAAAAMRLKREKEQRGSSNDGSRNWDS